VAKLQQFLDLLDRPGVREVVLQSNSQPAVRLDDGLRPVARQFLSTDHVLAIVKGSALERLLPQADEPRQTATFEHGGRLFAVKMARFGERIQVRIARSAANRRPAPDPPRTDGTRQLTPPPAAPTPSPREDVEEFPLPPVNEASAPHEDELPVVLGGSGRPPSIAAPSPVGKVALTQQDLAAALDLEPNTSPATQNLPRFARPLRPQRRISTEIEAIPLQADSSPPETSPDVRGAPEPDDLPPVLGMCVSNADSTTPTRPISIPSDPDPPEVATRTDSIPAMLGTAPTLLASSHPEAQAAATGAVVPVADLEPLSAWTPEADETEARGEPGSGEQRLASLMALARTRGASDVHLFSGQPARLRLSGELAPSGPALPHDAVKQMLLSPLTPTQLGELEERGHVETAIELEGAGRVRANICRQRAGLKGSFRLVPAEPESLDELGLPQQLATVLGQQQGVVLIAGPAGQGKSTTQAALVHLFNESRPVHVITIEEPIEVIHGIRRAVVSQREVGVHTNSFPQALRAALREDPDVIVVGELRDARTAEMVLTACQTGHLVLTTINAPSAQRAIERFIDLFPSDQQGAVRTVLAGALKLVAAQRLLRRADGTGMVPAVEIVTGGIALWTLIRDEKLFQLPALQRRGRQLGMVSLADAVDLLVQQDLVTKEEAQSVVAEPNGPPPVTSSAGTPVGGLRQLIGSRRS
jgi:twitching motility protein PilT